MPKQPLASVLADAYLSMCLNKPTLEDMAQDMGVSLPLALDISLVARQCQRERLVRLTGISRLGQP